MSAGDDIIQLMTESFSALKDEFLTFTSEIIWCTVTTVDGQGRPRSRILHPIWEVIDERPVGWIFTANAGVKGAHLAANPQVAFSYWSPEQNVVLGEAATSWVDDVETKRHVWEMFTTAPPPLGYDLREFGLPGPESEGFTVLRLDPWRVQVLDAASFARGNFTPRTALLK
ncbi:pyridoxamine 5'-phosphate oxidase family protein [Nonomuraea soli]